MYFKKLVIINFGPFRDFHISFSPVGVNLIVGANGTGKTQLIGAIRFALLGNKVVDIIQDGQLPSEVTLSIYENATSEIITRSLDGQKNEIQNTSSFTSSEPNEQRLSDFLLDILKSRGNPKLILTPMHKTEPQITEEELNSLSNFIWRDQETRECFNEAKNNIINADFRYAFLSEGQRNLVKFIKEYVWRQNVDRSFPLIVEDPLSFIDGPAAKVVGDLLDNISQKNQVILITHHKQISDIFEGGVEVYQELKQPSLRGVSSLSYNYFPNKYDRRSEDKVEVEQQFVLGQPIHVDESLYYEFKEVKGIHPTHAITDIVDQYGVAYLNLLRKGIGRIYWGIRNDDGVVVGVKLNVKERDELRRLVIEKLLQIQPSVAPSTYEINIIPVYSPDVSITELFIVEVKIMLSPTDLLYATGKGDVYLKTDAGKKKLSPIEIQKEVIKRRYNSG